MMQILPMVRDRCASWVEEGRGVITLGVWTEKREGTGEDAEPVVLHYWPTCAGVLAVCDGVGGAGVQVAGRTQDGAEHTGAWTASRAVRLAVEQWFVDRVSAEPPTTEYRPYESGLDAVIRKTLAQLRGPSRSRILGTMQREFPSTLALIRYDMVEGKREFVLDVRWAGDSRGYLLTSPEGLQQLTTDDTDLPDALESMSQDPPMTNQISAGRDFRINVRRLRDPIVAPCVLLCATDGFFNYVRTPAHFEYVLIDTLQEASTPSHWAQLLVDAVTGYAQDDATLALVALGYTGFGHLQQHFQQRHRELHFGYIQPMDAVDLGDGEAFGRMRLDSWNRYRHSYERRLSEFAEGAG